MDVKHNYDLTDLVNELEAQTHLHPDLIRELIDHLFTNIATRVGAAVNPVILKGIGTFSIEGRQAKGYKTPLGVVGITPKYLKLQFKGAKALRQKVEANLREPVRDLKVK
jgi:nucleoid DNA-binding protein